ncbi:hypothetical protein CapIbe_006944 [Capra ibex]
MLIPGSLYAQLETLPSTEVRSNLPSSGATNGVTPSQQERLRSKGVLRPLALECLPHPSFHVMSRAGVTTTSPMEKLRLLKLPQRRGIERLHSPQLQDS